MRPTPTALPGQPPPSPFLGPFAPPPSKSTRILLSRCSSGTHCCAISTSYGPPPPCLAGGVRRGSRQLCGRELPPLGGGRGEGLGELCGAAFPPLAGTGGEGVSVN